MSDYDLFDYDIDELGDLDDLAEEEFEETATYAQIVQDDAVTEEVLQTTLRKIVVADQDYNNRNPLVAQAVALALLLGMPAGYRVDRDDPEWPVAFIQLPTGQVSWHTPQFAKAWDGHSTTEKFDRIARYCDAQV